MEDHQPQDIFAILKKVYSLVLSWQETYIREEIENIREIQKARGLTQQRSRVFPSLNIE